jgi:hypothetical protein
MAYVAGEVAREEFRARLWRLNLLDREAAAALGVHDRTLYKWLSGERSIPLSAVRLLDLMLAHRGDVAPQQSDHAAPHNRPSPMLGGERGKGGL